MQIFWNPKEEISMRKQKGFSLIELLIVVAIILIIAAIAIPNLLKARISANNSAAAATVRTLSTAETTYTTNYPSAGFAPSLTVLGPGAATCAGTGTSANACIIDSTLGCSGSTWCVKDAFWYNITTTTNDYTISAEPIAGQGSKSFCANGDGAVHVQDPNAGSGTAATAPSTAITQATCAGLPAQ
jgi:type IV pilus assembly protein PilA